MKTLIALIFLIFVTLLTENTTQAQMFDDGTLDSTGITSASPGASWLNNPRWQFLESVVKSMTSGDSIGAYNIIGTGDTIGPIAVINLLTGSTVTIVTGVTGTAYFRPVSNNIHRYLIKSTDSGAGVLSGRRNVLLRRINYR